MMSQEYVKKKCLEALDASSENSQEAAQLLRVWAESDSELKNSLINPFLPNICALAIQSASAGTKDSNVVKKANENSLLSAIASSETLTMSSTRQPQSPPLEVASDIKKQLLPWRRRLSKNNPSPITSRFLL